MIEHLSPLEIGAVVLLNFAICVSILFATYAFNKIMEKRKKK